MGKKNIGEKISQEEIQEIERLTGGKIGTHTFGPNNEHTLENSFLSLNSISKSSIGTPAARIIESAPKVLFPHNVRYDEAMGNLIPINTI